MRQLRERWQRGDEIFHVGDGWAVLDPAVAQRVNAANFGDALLPDRLVDLLRRRSSPEVPWKRVRAAWAGPLKELTAAAPVADLEARLRRLVEERLDRRLDLAWAIQEIFTQALVPSIVADLTPRETRTILAEQRYKLGRLMRPEPRKETASEQVRSALLQIRAGRVARRILRQRRSGRRPRRTDLTDPLVDLLPELGMDRAAHAVTAVFTAIAGPPGAVAVATLLELARRPDWSQRLADESAAIPDRDFHTDPRRVAPETHRFVRECLRLWTSPLILTRVARRPLQAGEACLSEGERFHLSPYFAHHDPREWKHPERFEPDRWRPDSDAGRARPCAYAPFGHPPTSCIGAHLGLVELMLLCRLFVGAFRIDAENLDGVEMVLASVPLPRGFIGRLLRR